MAQPYPSPDIRVLQSAEEWCRAAAGEIVRCGKDAAQRKGRFTVALSGGSTPRPVYELLATHATFRQLFPWKQTHFFWSDERCVPPDAAESNYRMGHEALLSRVPVAQEQIHRVPAELPDATQAALNYEKTMREFFRAPTGKIPRLDLVLLGLGPDGHTASLFPGTDLLNEKEKLVSAVNVPKLGARRITFTLPLINQAAIVLFLVRGEEKAEILREVLQGNGGPPVPARMVHPTNGRLLWILDSAAAKLL